MTNHLPVLAAALALTSLSLVACAAPDPQDPATAEPALTSEKPDFTAEEAAEHAPFADAVDEPADPKSGASADAVPGSAPIGEGIAPALPSARGVKTPASVFVEQCTGVWSCSQSGLLILHREGPSCVLGDYVLEPGGRARYREESGATPGAAGSWRLEARTIDVSPLGSVTLHCDRQD